MEFNKLPEWGSRFQFPENQKIEFDDLQIRVTHKIITQMIDDYETAVASEIASAARVAGVSDVTVLNKKAILEALEKQIPQQVIMNQDEILCPTCRYDMMGLWDYPNVQDPNFCPICGQALDWGHA